MEVLDFNNLCDSKGRVIPCLFFSEVPMTCYRPLTGYVSREPNKNGKYPIVFDYKKGWIDRKVSVPCGQCLGCRKLKVTQWAARIMHEASLYDENCFITLTYNNENLPPDGGLCFEDFQKFMKRLRKYFTGSKIRFFHSGEYGEKDNRPHYHAVLFGFNFPDRIAEVAPNGAVVEVSEVLRSLWNKGFVSISDLTEERAAYVARYIIKKFNGELAATEYGGRRPPYSTMSRGTKLDGLGGIGFKWLQKFSSDVYNFDRVVMDSGKMIKPPRYYDDKYSLTDSSRFDKLKGKRAKVMRLKRYSKRVRRLGQREKYQEYILEKKRREHEITGL